MTSTETTTDAKAPIFTDREVQMLAYATICGAPETGATEEDMARVIGWAEQVKIDNALVDLLLSGLMAVDASRAELHFSAKQEDGLPL